MPMTAACLVATMCGGNVPLARSLRLGGRRHDEPS